MTEPPIKMAYLGRFYTGTDANLVHEPHYRTYQRVAKRIAFRALTSGKVAAQLIHVLRVGRPGGPATGEHHVTGTWLTVQRYVRRK